MAALTCACNLVVALTCEAKPLIDHYQLKRDYDSHAFEVYRNKEQPINLIITGIGKIAMAVAVSYLQQYLSLTKGSSYLNVGIAGGAGFCVGDLLLVNKVTDAATQKTIYPNVALLKASPSAEIISFDLPQGHYPENAIIDMEAAAFFQAARMFVHHDSIHAVKIISDTQTEEMQSLSAIKVESLIQQKLPEIDKIFQQLLGFVIGESYAQDVKESTQHLQQRWHFSVYQKNQLQQILRRWFVLLPKSTPLQYCEKAVSAAQVLKILANHLENIPYEW